jgi:hypothetical protein
MSIRSQISSFMERVIERIENTQRQYNVQGMLSRREDGLLFVSAHGFLFIEVGIGRNPDSKLSEDELDDVSERVEQGKDTDTDRDEVDILVHCSCEVNKGRFRAASTEQANALHDTLFRLADELCLFGAVTFWVAGDAEVSGFRMESPGFTSVDWLID